MMFVSRHLAFDPTKPLPPMVEPLCNVRREIPDEVNVHAFRAGQWWVYPLARGAGPMTIVGLRMVPGAALRECPVVEIDGAQGVTVASRAAYLVPMRLEGRIRSSAEAWAELAALPTETWNELVAFHHALGGEDDLDEVRAMVADGKVKAAYESSELRTVATAYFEAQARLDKAAETQAYAQYMIRAIRDRAAPVPTPEAGCWNDSLSSLALFYCQRDAADDEPRDDDEKAVAWRRMHELPGLDSARSGRGFFPGDEVAASAKLNLGAAKVVVKRGDKDWANDPLYPAIDKLANTKKYDGAAHVAAAETMAKAGDGAGAFHALIAASYWEAVNKGAAKRDTLTTARQLARGAGWAQLADCLDEQDEVRREVGA